MAIRETIQIAQPVAEASALPGKIPVLPQEITDRFESAEDFNTQLSRFWGTTRDLLIRDHNEVATAANTAVQKQNLLFSQSESLLTEIRRVNKAMIDGDYSLAQQISTLVAGVAGNRTYIQSATPSSPAAGDIWYKTDEGFKQFRYDGAAWIDVSDQRIAAGVSALSQEAQTRYQDDQALTSSITGLVARLNTGDIATAISSLQTAVGSTGSLAQSVTAISARLNTGDVATAISSLQTAVGPSGNLAQQITSLSSSLGNKIVASATAPTNPGSGCLWFDTAHGNKPWIWSGTAWVSATESDLVQAKSDISTIQSTYATKTYAQTMRDDAITAAASSATNYTDGKISNLASIYATQSSVTASLATTLTAAANDAAAKVGVESNVRSQADGYLAGKYTIRVDVNGVAAGMNISSTTSAGTNTSEISFLSNVFKIYTSAGAVAPFTVSGTTVYISGGIVISNSNISGLGALATANSVDLSTQVTNKSLSALDSAAATKLAGIAAGATVGATWGSNLTGVPVELTDGRIVTALNSSGTVTTRVVPLVAANPSGAGLYLGNDRMGYYSGSVWKTYMDNTGRFYLSGDANNSFAWDGSTLSLTGTVNCGSGKLTAGKASFFTTRFAGGSVLSLNSTGGAAGTSYICFDQGTSSFSVDGDVVIAPAHKISAGAGGLDIYSVVSISLSAPVYAYGALGVSGTLTVGGDVKTNKVQGGFNWYGHYWTPWLAADNGNQIAFTWDGDNILATVDRNTIKVIS